MSTTPPPPPYGPAGGPIPNPGVYDRRAMRAQRQAAAAQARWQRDQLRMQMRAARRTSIVGPILLVGLGVVLLLLESGRLHWPAVLDWLAHWWPGILILAGILMMGEWALDRQQIANSAGAIAPRRTLGGGTFIVLFLLAFVGACMMAAEHGSRWAERNFGHGFADHGFGDWRPLLGNRADFTQDLQASLAADGNLVIDNPRGDITLSGSSQDGQVHVSVQQHVYTWQQSDVEQRRRAEQPALTGDRSHLSLVVPSQDQDAADLSIEVPHDAMVTIHSNHGNVSLGELRGAAQIDSNGGDIKLTGLSGPVHLRTHDDNGTITAHSLAAGLALEGHSGDISLSDVDGAVTLRGDFFGTTHLEHIRGTVNFQSSFTNFACAGIPGELSIEGRSDLDAHQLEGPVTLSTTDRNLTLNGVRGAATVSDKNGSVTLTVAGPPQPVRVSNSNGSIELALPPNRGFSVDARTDNGDIDNDFGLNADKTGDANQLHGRIADGGPTMALQTTEGDITIRRASSDELADWSEPTQHITATPAKPQHHKPGAAKEPAPKDASDL